MNEQENLAMENIAENAEVAAEQITGQESEVAPVQPPETTPEKVYTEEEFKAALGAALDKKTPRLEARIRKEYDRMYGPLENVLKAATGKNDVAEMTAEFRQYYESQGVKIPEVPTYSEHDAEILANADADDIIDSGLEEVIAESERLAKIGVDKMNLREKAVFRKLAEYRKNEERARELSALGVPKDVYDSKEFMDFSAKFSSGTPVTEIYEYYSKMQPRKEVTPPESMRGTATGKEAVKDFYTFEEASKFTVEDFNRNPALLRAVEASMRKW